MNFSLYKYLAFCLFLIATESLVAQNRIVLHNKTVIPIDSVFRITTINVEYIISGSTHDVLIENISYIENNAHFITFDDSMKPVFSPIKDKKYVMGRHVEHEGKVEEEKMQLAKNIRLQNEMLSSFSFFPLALLEPDQGIRFGYEIPLIRNLSLHQDFNYLLQTAGDPNYNFWQTADKQKMFGYAYRIELRLYFEPLMEKGMRSYIAPQLMYKYKEWEQHTEYSRQLNRQVQGKIEQNIYAGNLKMGITTSAYNMFIFDLYTGFGLKYKKVTETRKLPDNISGTNVLTYNTIYPNLLLGFSLGYRLAGT